MNRVLCLLVIVVTNVFVANASSVSNVRLVDHRSYAISIIQKTINRLENMYWCNLKLEDLKISISDNILGVAMSADVEFTNGFLVSLRKVDIVSNTVQQVWLPVRGNTTRVEVQATMRMLDVVVGFDIVARMKGNTFRSTGVMRYPEINFPFVITKNLFTDAITVTVRSLISLTSNLMEFSPENEVTKVLPVLFNWNSTANSVQGWASNVFAPIVLDLAENEIEFPRMCYNCPVTA